MLSESIPLGGTFAEAPELFSVQFFLPARLGHLSIGWLLVPALPAFALGLAPALARRPHPACLGLVAAGLTFYPLVVILREHVHHPYTHEGPDALLWALLAVLWAGVVLWVREPDYLWSSAAGGALWDMGAAVRGHGLGVERIGVPYHPGLPPAWVIAIDATLFTICVGLWLARANPHPWIEATWVRLGGELPPP